MSFSLVLGFSDDFAKITPCAVSLTAHSTQFLFVPCLLMFLPYGFVSSTHISGEI